MTVASKQKVYRIGVDVDTSHVSLFRGTNTDAVLACRLESDPNENSCEENQIEILSSYKSQTTPDISSGIRDALQQVMLSSQVSPDSVISVNIGTTHFINAVIQADMANLERVAVLRLCGPFCREVPPFQGFPAPLRRVVEGYSAYLDGGLEIDGRQISQVDASEVAKHARNIRDKGLTTVVVIGIFSPLDIAEVTQEEHVRNILQGEIPGVDVVCSKDIGQVGFVERENASILNGSILKFARRTIASFQAALSGLGLHCPLYLTQNDSTIMDTSAATHAPIKTFSSGATNSLAGAVFLSGIHQNNTDIESKEFQIIMVDIGGTTSDFAAISPSGLPRQASATAKIGGVRTAFRMPDVVSIGLGGGSLVQISHDRVSVGPVSVGHGLQTESICFGGKTLTATDIVAAKGLQDDDLPEWKSDISPDVINGASQQISAQLGQGIETMKTSDAEVVLLLVGGGSVIQDSQLQNVKQCIRPPFYKVANAVGAAIAKVSGEIDRIVIPNGQSHDETVARLKEEAIALAHQNGARPGSVQVMEFDLIPLQYTANQAVRAVVKATGELEWRRCEQVAYSVGEGTCRREPTQKRNGIDTFDPTPNDMVNEAIDNSSIRHLSTVDLETYIPDVSKKTGEWFVSELDLEFIGEGCGILGTGGGGSVYSALVHSIETLRSVPSKRMRIIESRQLAPESKVAMIAYAGAPSVSNERLIGGDELALASADLSKFLGIPGYEGVMAVEIGGSNGMRTFASAATMDLPIVDADTMGRALPKVDMALPYVFARSCPTPAVLSDARGNVQVVARVEDSHRFESIIRTACVELGLYTALSLAPLSSSTINQYCCLGGVSMAWFMGRAICLARRQKTDVVKSLLGVIPGGQLLYSGKVVDVKREVKGGWTVGTATFQPFTGDAENTAPDERQLVLGYQNEFFSASLRDGKGDSEPEPLCMAPDLITVLDSPSGTALATHELRYGLRVAVIAMPAHPLWMTKEGLKAGGPQAFGLSDDYKPLKTKWSPPPSVFHTYAR